MSSIDSQLQVPDDIFALYSRFELDTSRYRVFRRESGASHQANAIPVAEPIITEQRPVVGSPLSAREPVAPIQARIPLNTPAPATLSDDRVQNATKDLVNLRRILAAYRQKQLSQNGGKTVTRTVIVRGISGGVGTTTVTATLARQLSHEGLRIGIYDEREDSLLPMFFGMRALAINHRSDSLMTAPMDHAVHLLPRIDGHDFSLMKTQFTREMDCILVDEPTNTDSPVADSVPVLVTLADIGSTLKLLKSPLLDAKRQTICVINRYNPFSEMQLELRHWYESEFAKVICIEQSSDFAETLAQGSTVLDQVSPNSHMSAFKGLANAVLGRPNDPSQAPALQTGKLALCL
jgi:hypothetical protein